MTYWKLLTNGYLDELKEHIAGLDELDYDINMVFSENYVSIYFAFLAFIMRDTLNVNAEIIIIDQRVVGEVEEPYEVFKSLLSRARTLRSGPSSAKSFFREMYEDALKWVPDDLLKSFRNPSKRLNVYAAG